MIFKFSVSKDCEKYNGGDHDSVKKLLILWQQDLWPTSFLFSVDSKEFCSKGTILKPILRDPALMVVELFSKPKGRQKERSCVKEVQVLSIQT